ncbi:phosphatidylinositol 4-kinase gamma 4-like [Aristolochia californica]|uniref:phosphatidylinositol 4-kinase gamma 4-like n=1 Tax=Aristolochia californica TaxID=171875 RepID=UPI0035DED416
MSCAGVALSSIRENDVLSPIRFHGRLDLCSQESILIYLTVSGSVIPMRVLESDSIASLKMRIQSFKGFVMRRQKLVFEGRELARNNCLVKDYGVSDGNVLHLVHSVSNLRVITVKTSCGKELEFQVERCRNVGYIKQQIAEKDGVFSDLKDQELVCKGKKLDDQRLIDDICEASDAVIHLLVKKSAKVRVKPVEKNFELSIVASNETTLDDAEVVENPEEQHEFLTRKSPDRDFWIEPVQVNPGIELSSIIRSLINATFDGLEKGNAPVRSSEGSGGAYFMWDSSGNKYVSVFKPIDEEPMAINNPQGWPVTIDGEGLKRGTKVGEGALREVAAYILDHPISGPRSYSSGEIGFSGVPPTAMVKCLHEGFNHPQGFEYSLKNVKIGSLQTFVNNYGNCEDMGPLDFPTEEVHKISVLDIRLANADRHAGNILVCKEGDEGHIKLVPIDHGYCLPETFEDCTFDWLYWPQARKPYNCSILDYIKSLDAEQDIALLKSYGWNLSVECSRTLRISTMLLKKGAERGLSPYAIGSMMCRPTVKKESVIEEIVYEAQEAVLPGMSEEALLEYVSLIMDRRLDEVAN